MAVIPFKKNLGETPLQALDRLRILLPLYKDSKLTYAGRLDPMAVGLLIILSDNDVHRKEEFLSLDKTYEVQILFGVLTDTFDTLGLCTKPSKDTSNLSVAVVKQSLQSLVGTHTFLYPLFSSKPVDGKPLFTYALSGTIDTISVPMREMTIHALQLKRNQMITSRALYEQVLHRLTLVRGNFRQEEIRNSWENWLKHTLDQQFLCVTLTVHCSSGTYMRTLAHQLGKSLETGAIAYSINRTAIGSFLLE